MTGQHDWQDERLTGQLGHFPWPAVILSPVIKRTVSSPVLLGEQGWHSGESAHLPLMQSGFFSQTWSHMWVEFVVGSSPCFKGFSPDSLVFLPPQKSTLLNSNSIWKQWMKSHFVEMPLQIPIHLFIYFLNYFSWCGEHLDYLSSWWTPLLSWFRHLL